MDNRTDELDNKKVKNIQESSSNVEEGHDSTTIITDSDVAESPVSKKARGCSSDTTTKSSNADDDEVMKDQQTESSGSAARHPSSSSLPLSSSPLPPLSKTECVAAVRKHYEWKGYRVHSGLQFGTDLVLYADTPDRVHSDFCIHVIPEDKPIDWRTIQTLVRSMPDLHKTLYLVNVHRKPSRTDSSTSDGTKEEQKKTTTMESNTPTIPNSKYIIRELAIGSEHAPFRQKHIKRTQNFTKVGTQTKPNASANENITSTTGT